MARLMSVALTETAVRDRRKTVTRRAGWSFLRPGDQLELCRKVMGRRRGEPLERICMVEVVDVRRERLSAITASDVTAEGFTPAELAPYACGDDPVGDELSRAFCRFFVEHIGGGIHQQVTRIEWRYLDSDTTHNTEIGSTRKAS